MNAADWASAVRLIAPHYSDFVPFDVERFVEAGAVIPCTGLGNIEDLSEVPEEEGPVPGVPDHSA